jgi:hypothetical protein
VNGVILNISPEKKIEESKQKSLIW